MGDNTAPFSNFSQDNRDAYMRLKFRALNKQSNKGDVSLNSVDTSTTCGLIRELEENINTVVMQRNDLVTKEHKQAFTL